MFAHLSHYNKILVTGPQRSGTTIAARMIAHDTGLTYLPEEYVRVNCERSLRHVLETHDHFVLQCPALQHLMHLPGVGDREDTLVVYTDRPPAEILASAARVGWGGDTAEREAWGVRFGLGVEIKQLAWEKFQVHLIRNHLTIVYSSLASHPLWVCPELRGRFGLRQTAVDDPGVECAPVPLPLLGETDMKPLVLAAVLLTATAEDLKYELQVREAFTAFEAQVEAIRTETGTNSADRLVPVLMTRRSLWKATEGSNFYERLSNGFWVEQSPKGEALIYREITRTPEYVEIATGSTTASTVIHLTEGTSDVKQSKDRSFKTYYKGGWAR